MARFDGVFPAAEIKPAPCGLLSVATVQEHSVRDEQWVSGFSVDATATPTVRIVSFASGIFDEGTLSEDDPKIKKHYTVAPFSIEIEVKRSGLDLISNDPLDGLNDQIEAVTQKAVERELWEGLTGQKDDNSNIFLRAAKGEQILTTSAVHPKRGLAILEGAVSLSPTGGAGTLHMTRETASSIVGGGLGFQPDPEDPTKGALFTSLGTPVVCGSGYTGNGPLEATGSEASGMNRWMFLTGPVTVHLGEIETVNDTLRQGFLSNTNDSVVKAYRPAAVSFDPAMFYAVQITLPDVP